MLGENENMDLPFADETILARWLSDELTDAERRQVEEHPDFADWQRIDQESKRLQGPAYDELANWKKLQQPTNDKSKARPQLKAIRWAAAIAASLLLLVSLYFFLPSDHNQEFVTTTTGAEHLIEELPDESIVRLNAESSISFQKENWSNNRSLDLKGEAFFEVEEGSRFVVQTSVGEVEVLGTTFNVYARGSELRVYCFSGRVMVRALNGRDIELGPGRGVKLKDGVRAPLFTDDRIVPGWTKGETNFKNEELPEIFKTVERQFGVEVIYDTLPQKRYSGPLPHTNLEEALNVICPPLALKFSILGGNQVRISQ